LEWIHPPVALAHPFDDGSAALLDRSLEKTAASLENDSEAYLALMSPLVSDWERIAPEVLAPLHFPKHPLALARFGIPALQSASTLAKARFNSSRARGLFAGLAAHSFLPLERPLTAAFSLVLGILAHAVGWPFPRGGAQQISNALASYFRSLGGEIITSRPIQSLEELPESRCVLLDLTPRQIIRLAGDHLPSKYVKQLEKYRYGPGAFKIDWALDGPIPFIAPECAQAGTIHLGGSLEEIIASENAVWHAKVNPRPFVILAQPSLFDSTRAPQGKHTAWAYCHVPHASTADMTEEIESQIERFAPGFRKRILARHVMNTQHLESYNANYVGGDINGGVQDWRQLFTRPVFGLSPYTTPMKDLFICSSSTPPGGGVHGMCGYHAARVALRRVFRAESSRIL